MARSRAQVFRGAGFQPSRRESQLAERKRVSEAFEREAAEPQKLSILERVLPGRRLTAKARAASRVHQRQQFEQMGMREDKVRTFQSNHRRAFRGITTVNQVMRLSAIGRARKEAPDAPTYRHPQKRRVAREMRIAAHNRAVDEAHGVVPR